MLIMEGHRDGGINKFIDLSKHHEPGFRIEMNIDRVIRWIGIYIFLAMAVLVRINIDAVDNFSCFPGNKSRPDQFQLISFANSYCWINIKHNGQSACRELKENAERSIPPSESNFLFSLNQPYLMIYFLRWFPFIVFQQVVFFSIPFMLWNYFAGQLLTCWLHCKIEQLNEIFDKCTENGKMFCLISGKTYSKNNQDSNSPTEDPLNVNNEEDALLSPMEIMGRTATVSSCSMLQNSLFDRLIVGSMTDREFLAMILHENLSQINSLSIFRAYSYHPKNHLSLLKEIVNLSFISHESFDKKTFIRWYLTKHLITFLISFTNGIVMIAFIVLFYNDILRLDPEGCQLPWPFSDVCMLCTIKDKSDPLIVSIYGLVFNIVIMCLSLLQFFNVRKSKNYIVVKNISDAFKELFKTYNQGYN